MKKFLKLKITLRIMLLVTIVFVISNTAVSYLVRKQMFEEAERNAEYEMDKLILYTDQQLQAVETAAGNMLTEIRIEQYNLENNYRFLEHFLESNPCVEEVFLAIDPKQFVGDIKEAWCAVMQNDTTGGVERIYSDGTIRYASQSWFIEAMQGKTGWSSPLVTLRRHVLEPYTIPIYDPNGGIVGAAAICLSLDEMSARLKESRPFMNAVVTMIDNERNFICHPDTSMILRAKVDDLIVTAKNATKAEVLTHIDTNKRGRDFYNEGRGHYKLLYYAPVEKTDWTVLMQCDEDDIFAGTHKINMAMVLALLFNLLVFGFVLWRFFKVADKSEKQLIANAHIESERNTAARLQLTMVPKVFPPFPERSDIDVYASIRPAKAVGGDFYDFFIRDEKLFITIGDVAGKGIPASMVMAIYLVLFRIFANKTDDPAEILTLINNYSAKNNPESMFVTMQIGCLDLATGHIVYCNAGHNSPLVIHQSGATTEASFHPLKPGLPIGCMDGFDYVNEEATLLPGSLIYMYTDGITEAMDDDNQFYGEERLREAINALPPSATTTEIVQGVEASVNAFTHGAQQADDMTSLCICYTPNNKSQPLQQH